MKVLLIGNFTPDRQQSMLRFGQMLQDGLTARGHDVTSLAPSPVLTRLARPYRYGGWPKYVGYVDKFVLFPRRLRQVIATTRPDVVHIVDHANAAYAGADSRGYVLVTCHDLLQIRAARGQFPQQYVGRGGRRLQAWIAEKIAQAPHLACVSRETAHQVLRELEVPRERVSVIPNALNYPYRPMPAHEAWSRVRALTQGDDSLSTRLTPHHGGFILNIGGGQWYKNRAGLLDIYAQLRRRINPAPMLAMVGTPLSAADTARARALGLAGQIWAVGNTTNEDLRALYSVAQGLLFPSWQEGFGWPIAEAQACGCVAFTSDRAPMNEVGGASAIYFDPESPTDAAERIAAAWPTRQQRRELGLQEAKRWEPALMFDAYERLYALIASSASSRTNHFTGGN